MLPLHKILVKINEYGSIYFALTALCTVYKVCMPNLGVIYHNVNGIKARRRQIMLLFDILNPNQTVRSLVKPMDETLISLTKS